MLIMEVINAHHGGHWAQALITEVINAHRRPSEAPSAVIRGHRSPSAHHRVIGVKEFIRKCLR